MNEHLRYYGRRKAQEDSDSELSGLEEDKTEENRARAQPRLLQYVKTQKTLRIHFFLNFRPELGNANGGNGKMWSSRAKVSKTPHQHGARLPIPS